MPFYGKRLPGAFNHWNHLTYSELMVCLNRIPFFRALVKSFIIFLVPQHTHTHICCALLIWKSAIISTHTIVAPCKCFLFAQFDYIRMLLDLEGKKPRYTLHAAAIRNITQ